MCGICGFSGKKDKRLLEAMAMALSHRGPDDQGFYEDDGVSLGHRRLSIIDLTAQGRQPMSNENAAVWAVVNGEIYNFKSLREELISHGHIFRSHSDSEVVVHAYEQYGEDFASRLEGMFALAVWDIRQKRLILARDRIGIKPLYYAQHNERLLFASEIKAILEDDGVKRKLNEGGFRQYLAFQCIITSETMFEGINKLDPGSILIFQAGQARKKKYWSLEEAKNRQATGLKVREALFSAVKSHLVSDVPVGVLLSGGLDSSAIVAIMAQLGVSDIETFTVGFGQPDDEFDFARQVADKFKTRHHELLIECGQLPATLEKIVRHMDEPLADGGAIATYLAAQKLRESVKVVLVGEGGDEALGGYNWYRISGFPLTRQLKKKLYFYLTTFYRGADKKPYEVFQSLFKDRDTFFDSMAGFEIENILPNSLLMKVDKMTMAFALEARVPFLDAEFVGQASGLDHREKISALTTKMILRKIMLGYLPREILARKKHGFILPVSKWLTGELKDFAYDNLFSSSNQTDRILGRKLKEWLFEKKSGLKRIENTSLLWKLLIFELWNKAFMRR